MTNPQVGAQQEEEARRVEALELVREDIRRAGGLFGALYLNRQNEQTREWLEAEAAFEDMVRIDERARYTELVEACREVDACVVQLEVFRLPPGGSAAWEPRFVSATATLHAALADLEEAEA